MIEHECPHCAIPLRIPESAMGRGGTCNHCRGRFFLPSLWRHRITRAGRATWPVLIRIGRASWPIFLSFAFLPFRIVSHLIGVNTSQHASWRNDPMTERQAEFLIELGAGYYQIQGFTKGQASDLITQIKDSKR